MYGNKWAVISRGIPGRYRRDARLRRTRPNQIQHARHRSRDSVRSFRRADAEPSFVVHAPGRNLRAFLQNFSWIIRNRSRFSVCFFANRVRGKIRPRLFGLAFFSPIGRMSVFRHATETRSKLKGRASAETRAFCFVYATDGQTRAERRRALFLIRPTICLDLRPTTTDRKRNHPVSVSCVRVCLFTSTCFAGRITR